MDYLLLHCLRLSFRVHRDDDDAHVCFEDVGIECFDLLGLIDADGAMDASVEDEDGVVVLGGVCIGCICDLAVVGSDSGMEVKGLSRYGWKDEVWNSLVWRDGHDVAVADLLDY